MELINHYEEAGAGEPLILLHGNGESCEYFSRQISYFKETTGSSPSTREATAKVRGERRLLPYASLPTTCTLL